MHTPPVSTAQLMDLIGCVAAGDISRRAAKQVWAQGGVLGGCGCRVADSGAHICNQVLTKAASTKEMPSALVASMGLSRISDDKVETHKHGNAPSSHAP